MNGADLEPRLRRLFLLAAMVGVFVIAHAVPAAFEGDGGWVAWGYVYVRFLALALLFVSSVADSVRVRAFWTYLPPTLVGPALVIIGAYQGGDQQWWWLAAVGAEVLSAEVAGRADWKVDPAHFAERHGLIMIIALGESIVVVGDRSLRGGARRGLHPSWRSAAHGSRLDPDRGRCPLPAEHRDRHIPISP